MKKFFALAMSFVFILSGCVSSDEPMESPDIVVAEVKESSAYGITLSIKNNFHENYVFGEEYYLEKKNGGKWEEVPELEGDFFFNIIAYVIMPESESEWSTNWESRYSLQKGEYRIVMDGRFENEEGQQTGTHRMTAEFTVG